MATAFDVAAYILEQKGSVSHMKLQKLVYYSQAWSLVWDEKPLFSEKIEAWANGPVVKTLFNKFKGSFLVDRVSIKPHGSSANLNAVEKQTINAVLKFYGDKDPQWLSDLTHLETPWLEARHGLAPGARGHREITHACMAEYYGSL